MKILREASSGTLESSDVLVTVYPAETLSLEIESPVLAQYGDKIEATCREVLARLKVETGVIKLQDQGALDCTIRARLETAVRRAAKQED
ncbi:MAG TPA: citrate lyase acyl carrier protein [Clostridiaceae bacterium]|nr:citrate lyase acyl carrier protein [Clostridiaceae bacterium]